MRNGRTGAVLSKRDPPVQNWRVGKYATEVKPFMSSNITTTRKIKMYEKRSKIYLYVMYYNQIVSFWLEDITCEWYLRVTEDDGDDDELLLSELDNAIEQLKK